MKSLNFFFYLFVILIKSQFLYADNIALLDINFIINNSIIGQKTLKDISLINQENLTILKEEQLKLGKEKSKIESKKNIISKDQYQIELTSLNDKINEFKQKQDKMSLEFNELNKNKMNELLKKINPIIQQYMVRNEVKIVFNKESAYVSLSDSDITDDILKLIDDVFK